MRKYDIIVIGGGIAGTVAAIAAARCGSKVLIIEKNACLGGTITSGEVGPMMTFHVADKQVIRGITAEIIDRLKARGKSDGHIFDTTTTTYTVTPFDSEAMKYELDLMLSEAGGEVLYHTMLADAEVCDGIIKNITVCTKNGLMKLEAKMFIDASGDAALSNMAGVPCTIGRKKDGATQPMTLIMKMVNVDFQKIRESIKLYPEEFAEHYRDLKIFDKAPKMSFGSYNKRFKAAQERGDISFNRESVLLFETGIPGEAIVNSTRVQGLSPVDDFELSKAETLGRAQAHELEEFLKKECPGFENASLIKTGAYIGIRTGRQIAGKYTVTYQDLAEEKRYDDVIAHGGYPVDIHSSDGTEKHGDGGIKKFEYGTMYSVPYRAIINDTIKNIITVGRCISAEFEAVGALRVSPMAGAVGHAGGVAAHFAAEGSCRADEVDIRKIQETLINQGAYLEL